MAPRRLLASPRAGAQLRSAFQQIRDELQVPREFPAAVLAEAEAAAADPAMPDLDLTDLPFVTVDPAGSKDLDQAMCLARDGRGYRVQYAIADLGSFVRPGGAIDTEAHERGLTIYCPDTRVPLTPPVLSEDAASLLADQVRPAVIWTMDLDAGGEGTRVEVRRARVRSRAQLSFEEAQQAIDSGTDEQLGLLREIGSLRQARERARGGMSVTLPDQEIVARNGSYELVYGDRLPVEEWNAQLSLMTGSAGAELMLRAGFGVLRTMPQPGAEQVEQLRRTAAGLGVAWPDDLPYADLVPRLDPSLPANAAFLTAATVLMRGAGYTAFDGQRPELDTHAAVGGPYAHVTAPLRRLIDRHTTACCLAACAGEPVPDWVRTALPSLAAEMTTADRRANEIERACVEVVEAAVLAGRVGERFDAVVVDVRKDGSATVQLAEPAVRAKCAPGEQVRLAARIVVELVEADPTKPTVAFTPAQS